MGREVRRVPPNWRHPKDKKGNYVPLLQEFSRRLEEWDRENDMWQQGFVDDFNGGWKPRDENYTGEYTEWNGERPVKEDYMPEWTAEEATHYMMYECVSEGTPISPAFATPEELARWLADSGASSFGRDTASYESWLRVCNGGYAPSMIISGGVIQSGVEGVTQIKKQEEREPE